jgi:5-methylcytosine-specific restriction endonuclease McrA
MKRAPLPPRQKPLKAGAPLQRSQGPRRSTLTRTPPRPREARTVAPVPSQGRKRTGPTRQTRDLVRARDRGVCAWCGLPGTRTDPLVQHHRVNRGSGGSSLAWVNLPANLITCHASVNGAFEGDAVIADRARAAGWKVPRNGVLRPVDVPVSCWDGTWLLDDNGGRRKADA